MGNATTDDSFVNLLFAVFKDPTRRKILHVLREMKLTADEITKLIGISRPAIEKHLKQMMEVGLIERFADTFPTLRYLYSISQPGIELITNLEDSINAYITALYTNYNRKLENEEQRYLLGYSTKERYVLIKEAYKNIIEKLKRAKKFKV